MDMQDILCAWKAPDRLWKTSRIEKRHLDLSRVRHANSPIHCHSGLGSYSTTAQELKMEKKSDNRSLSRWISVL
jgi:hypothetical protein